VSGVTVTNGIFTVQLDFGSTPFMGADRYLEIRVKKPSDATYTTLTPRQKLTSAPYAIRALVATTADVATNATNATNAINANNASNLGGIPAANFVQTNTNDFVRNQTSQQGSANFNISGTGTANIFNAVTQYNIGSGRRILTIGDSSSMFPTSVSIGIESGQVLNTPNNSFFGNMSGRDNIWQLQLIFWLWSRYKYIRQL
jgi:hypothetical protein